MVCALSSFAFAFATIAIAATNASSFWKTAFFDSAKAASALFKVIVCSSFRRLKSISPFFTFLLAITFTSATVPETCGTIGILTKISLQIFLIKKCLIEF